MAETDINSVIESFKGLGNFMDKPSARTEARHDLIDRAPESIRKLLDMGFDQGFVARLARLEEENRG